MAFDLPPFRIGLYFSLFIFSLVLFVLSCVRIHYTKNIPKGDPLNGGIDFYDPVIPELIATTVLSMGWSIFIIHVIHKRAEPRFLWRFRGEIIGLFVLWGLYLGGAAAASKPWGNLGWCEIYQPCRILTALVAFAWIGWIVLTVLLVTSIMFSFANGALLDPLHGRWDPRASTGPQMANRSRS